MFGPGDLVAEKYEIVRELGTGGMGVVYLVRHSDIDVFYALKVLDEEISQSIEFVDQFKQEASLLQKFSHSRITQLRDFGRTESGLYYLAMDYAKGSTLKEVLERDGPYHVQGALEIVLQMLDVLIDAHQKGIIHKDIKPGNVILENLEDGTPGIRILDFGTALIQKSFRQDYRKNAPMGTPAYMAPEQAAGVQSLDQRADLYSLGVMLFELLTGELPFRSDDIVQVLLMHVTQTPPSLRDVYHVPHYVDELVQKALEKQLDKRYANATEFRTACAKVLQRHIQEKTQLRGAEGTQASSPRIAKLMEDSLREQGNDSDNEKTKILCLDDDEMIINIMRHLLEANGYEVFTAMDCSAVHDILFKENVRFLVSDVQMPGMPGTRICQLLKQAVPDLTVVLFSNIPETELERCSEENKADAWISKNWKPAEWLKKIGELAQGKKYRSVL